MSHCVRDRTGMDSDLGLFRFNVHKNEDVYGMFANDAFAVG